MTSIYELNDDVESQPQNTAEELDDPTNDNEPQNPAEDPNEPDDPMEDPDYLQSQAEGD